MQILEKWVMRCDEIWQRYEKDHERRLCHGPHAQLQKFTKRHPAKMPKSSKRITAQNNLGMRQSTALGN